MNISLSSSFASTNTAASIASSKSPIPLYSYKAFPIPPGTLYVPV